MTAGIFVDTETDEGQRWKNNFLKTEFTTPIDPAPTDECDVKTISEDRCCSENFPMGIAGKSIPKIKLTDFKNFVFILNFATE